MFLLLDTCFCLHCEELYSNNIFDIRPLLKNFFLATTEAVKEELIHYKLNKFLPISEFVLFPLEFEDILKIKDDNALVNELDNADQTLWIVGENNKKDEIIILTDDGALLIECQIANIQALRLPSFLLFLLRNEEISKNDVYKCLRFWSKVGRYSQHDLKHWKQDLIHF